MAINKMYTLPKGTEPTDNIVNGLLTGTQRMNSLENYDKLYDYYMFAQKSVRSQILMQKYQSLLSNLFLSNPVEAKQIAAEENEEADE